MEWKTERRAKAACRGIVTAALVLSVLLGNCTQAMAAAKITTVSLTVEDEFLIGEDCDTDDVTVTAKSSKYYVDGVEIMNECDQWGQADIPVIEVTLQAEDGYYFSVSAADVTVKGAEYKNKRRGDDSYSMIVTLELPSMAFQIGEIEHAGWESQTVASWNPAINAAVYELSLYRNGKSAGKVQNITETSCDLAAKMTKEGTYSYKVRGINGYDLTAKSEWCEAEGSSFIDGAAAEQLRGMYIAELPEGVTEPGQLEAYNQANQMGWIQDHVGWWYKNQDGSYTTSNWQLIDGKWYYFDSVGYMVTGWIQWNGNSYYCNPGSGEMLSDMIIPDGSGRRVDSTGAWIQ